MSVSLAEACDELAAKCDVEVAVRMRFTVQCVVVIVWGASEMFRRTPTMGRVRWVWWWWAMVAAAVVAPAMALAAAVSGIAVATFLAVYLMWRGVCKYLRPLRSTDVRRAVVYVFITPILSCIGLAMGALLAAACSATLYECVRAMWTLFLYVGLTYLAVFLLATEEGDCTTAHSCRPMVLSSPQVRQTPCRAYAPCSGKCACVSP